jgi:glycosyltransferase involved in cell wall biosynthesis
MNILLISQYYPPEIGAPQARLSEMSDYWVKRGHKVTVYTAMPNHPTGVLPTEYAGKTLVFEKLNGVNLVRHWTYITPNKGFIKKIISHLSFMFSVFFLSTFRGKKPDIIIVSSPTFFATISAWLISLIRRSKFIFEVRDLWPGIFVELGVLKNKLIIFVLESIELFLYRRSDIVITVTDSFKSNISKRNVNSSKIHVIKNGVNLELFKKVDNNTDDSSELRSKLGYTKDDFIVLYIGAHGISQALDKILLVAKKTKEIDSNIKFLFVGDGATKKTLIQIKSNESLDNVHFHGSVKREDVLDFYKLSNINLVTLKNIDGFSEFIPSKIFEIFASYRPIIGSLKGEAASILTESKGAIVVPPEDINEITSAIIKLKDSPELRSQLGVNGRSYVENNFNRHVLAEKYLTIMEECLSKS